MNHLYSVLKKPVISEKSVSSSNENHYYFFVEKEVNKITVAEAIKEIYGIKPLSVKIINLPKKMSGKGRVKRLAKKKAVVVLAKKDKLDIAKMKFL
ncbi:MAG: 50S ribosomal protein L23 [Candidatus Abawacabacteria bacterium RBG_16_42_10]|uniref:Large ribosomal subunit protein uL23 n=2 Tax=Bacteria TaxID=2 RepID=A0A0H4T3A0_9BACT|nr:50S ribosomal protein L23, large subunit ribosomal protein L23 [uncultured bacterium Rifle_16ft_4_minimus_15147]OGC81387.1 MAG: 50S ribosomal protein L23 [Candidatus Abawacabacteria bacterium RBG_16_42_10]